MRVLIADDERCVGHSLADMVRCCGHDVVAVVGSGLEAIQAHTSYKPDLVLLDYRMPRLNGGTACRHILAKDPTARVVLLSAWSPLDHADECGATCFLPKPVDLARLSATLLTISHTLPIPPVAHETFDNGQFGHSDNQSNASVADTAEPATIIPFLPIPEEIISPVENFPIESPPLALQDNDSQTQVSVAAGNASPTLEQLAPQTAPADARIGKLGRRKKRARASAT